MSTNLNFKEPKNFLSFVNGESFLSAEFTTTKTRVDKKTTKIEYSAYWLLSGIVDGRPQVIGALETPVQAETEDEAIDRMEFLSDFVSGVIQTAADAKVEGVLTDVRSREIVAAAHARWHSSSVNGEEYGWATTVIMEFIKQFGVKNVKKVLSAVMDGNIDI